MAEKIGGVELNHVIQFQTRILFGAQYGRIELAKETGDKDQLLLACLRMGWNDAFRHVTENVDGVETAKKDYLKNHKTGTERYVTAGGTLKERRINLPYDDYYCSILADRRVMDAFKEFAAQPDSATIQTQRDTLIEVFSQVKRTDGTKPLCFGHIQKLFNIAMKMLLCLYLCREYLDLEDTLFGPAVVEGLKTAHCPVDGIILEQYEQKKMREKSVGSKHELTFGDVTWSQIKDPGIYDKIQDAFRNKCLGNSGLYFDFDQWK